MVSRGCTLFTFMVIRKLSWQQRNCWIHIPASIYWNATIYYSLRSEISVSTSFFAQILFNLPYNLLYLDNFWKLQRLIFTKSHWVPNLILPTTCIFHTANIRDDMILLVAVISTPHGFSRGKHAWTPNHHITWTLMAFRTGLLCCQFGISATELNTIKTQADDPYTIFYSINPRLHNVEGI
jgi:hypothetical protein